MFEESKQLPFSALVFFILTFLEHLWGSLTAESPVNTGPLALKCQKGSATKYAFYY